MTYRIQYFQDNSHPRKLWYWRIRHRNGQKIVTSEGYARQSSAMKASQRFIKAIERTAASHSKSYTYELEQRTKP